MEAIVKFCNVDNLFNIELNGEEIHHQQTRPNETDIIEAVKSDRWQQRFDEMREGEKVRVSERIYWSMLGSVPPIKQTATSFYCGEPYSGNKYYYFERDEDGKIYGQLKAIN